MQKISASILMGYFEVPFTAVAVVVGALFIGVLVYFALRLSKR